MASQLREPHGWFGTLVISPVMNRVNARIIDTTLSMMDLRPGQEVLEIGIGGGAALERLAYRIPGGVITGLDLGPDMVRRAERKFRRQIAAGRMRIQLGSVTNMPFRSQSFDRVFTINTIYFWPDVAQGMSEIRRVLKDGGLAAIGLRSRERMQRSGLTKHNFRLFEPEEVLHFLERAGVSDVKVDHRDRGAAWDQVIVVGKV
jgi:arsenite methyltransferase